MIKCPRLQFQLVKQVQRETGCEDLECKVIHHRLQRRLKVSSILIMAIISSPDNPYVMLLWQQTPTFKDEQHFGGGSRAGKESPEGAGKCLWLCGGAEAFSAAGDPKWTPIKRPTQRAWTPHHPSAWSPREVGGCWGKGIWCNFNGPGVKLRQCSGHHSYSRRSLAFVQD